MSHRILSWDWREQPDLDRLGDAVDALSGGRLQMHQVDTGSDQFAIILTDESWSDDEVAAAFDRWYRGES